MHGTISQARKTAAIAAVITVLLAASKAVIGALAESSALLADALHSTGDLFALGAVWFGLFLAMRKPTDRFPYGFYRAETLAALVCSAVIVYLGARLLLEGIATLQEGSHLAYPAAAISMAGVSAVGSFLLSRWEKRVSLSVGAQSLGAVADEARMDAVSSIVVVVALVAARYRVPYVEGAVTIGISGLIVWVGLGNASRALLALMDASVNPALEKEATDILADMPGVKKVEKLRARRSGPFYFLDGQIQVAASMDVNRSHALSHDAQRAIREKRPEVEAVVLHIEPYRGSVRNVLIPVQGRNGLKERIAEHFGRADAFLLATLEDGELKDFAVENNPFQHKSVRAGLAVINRFVKEKQLDAVIVRELGEIAFHGLRDNFVDVFHADEGTAEQILKDYAQKRLEYLRGPTHSSEEKLDDFEKEDEGIKGSIRTSLSKVIDPETGLDVRRMGLIKDLQVDSGHATLTFRPTSPVCPMAFKLASDIRDAVRSIPGINGVTIKVENFNRAAELEALLREDESS
jgi:cation diffusion facilitator family transporter